jgi:hypothetical protein
MTKIRQGSRPQRLKKEQAREALPENLRGTFDKLCEEYLHWFSILLWFKPYIVLDNQRTG